MKIIAYQWIIWDDLSIFIVSFLCGFNQEFNLNFIGDPDYKMQCVGFWKENLKSYLITFDGLDPYSKYRCWVYQRSDLNRILMSQGKRVAHNGFFLYLFLF